MRTCIRVALAGAALALTTSAASAQNVMVYLFDRLEQPTYARAWGAMLSGQRDIPPWLTNGAKGATAGPGHQSVVEGRDAELYYACQPHNCSRSRFGVMFTDRGRRAKGVLIVEGGTPRFFGQPDAVEAAALMQAAQ